MHLLPRDPSDAGESHRPHPWLHHVSVRLDELTARHDRTATHLDRLQHPELEHACQAKGHFVYLRDLMRMRLLAAHCTRRPGRPPVPEGLRARWAPLLRAHDRFEHLVGSSSEDPRTR